MKLFLDTSGYQYSDWILEHGDTIPLGDAGKTFARANVAPGRRGTTYDIANSKLDVVLWERE